MINYVLIRAIMVSESEYDVDIDTDLPLDVAKKLIKDTAAGIDEANVTDYGDESQSTVPEDYN